MKHQRVLQCRSPRLARCNIVRSMEVLHQCRMAQRDVQWCEIHGVVAAAQRSVEGALVSGKGNFSIETVSSLTGMSELGGSITFFSVIGLQCSS